MDPHPIIIIIIIIIIKLTLPAQASQCIVCLCCVFVNALGLICGPHHATLHASQTLQAGVRGVRGIHVSADGTRLLLHGPRASLYELQVPHTDSDTDTAMESAGGGSAGEARCVLVSDNPDTMAATTLPPRTATDAGGTWLVLNATFGVLHLHSGGGGDGQEMRGALPMQAQPLSPGVPRGAGSPGAGGPGLPMTGDMCAQAMQVSRREHTHILWTHQYFMPAVVFMAHLM